MSEARDLLPPIPVGVLWTPHGLVQVFLCPVAPIPAELVQTDRQGEA